MDHFYLKNIYQRRLKWFNRIRVSIALALAVLFHVGLYALFSSPQGDDADGLQQRGRPLVTFVAVDPQKHREFLLALDYLDPTLVARPSERFGFGHLFQRGAVPIPRETPLPPQFHEELLAWSTAELPDLPPPTTLAYPGGTPIFLELASHRRFEAVTNPTPEELIFPAWRSIDGAWLPQLFAEPEELREKAAQSKPQSPTSLSLRRRGGLTPGVRVVGSSGDAELDRLAARAVLRNLTRLPETAFANNAAELMVFWR